MHLSHEKRLSDIQAVQIQNSGILTSVADDVRLLRSNAYSTNKSPGSRPIGVVASSSTLTIPPANQTNLSKPQSGTLIPSASATAIGSVRISVADKTTYQSSRYTRAISPPSRSNQLPTDNGSPANAGPNGPQTKDLIKQLMVQMEKLNFENTQNREAILSRLGNVEEALASTKPSKSSQASTIVALDRAASSNVASVASHNDDIELVGNSNTLIKTKIQNIIELVSSANNELNETEVDNIVGDIQYLISTIFTDINPNDRRYIKRMVRSWDSISPQSAKLSILPNLLLSRLHPNKTVNKQNSYQKKVTVGDISSVLQLTTSHLEDDESNKGTTTAYAAYASFGQRIGFDRSSAPWLTISAFGTTSYLGFSSIGPQMRVYNRRYTPSYLYTYKEDNPFRAIYRQDLPLLQKQFSERELSIDDCDQHGDTLLHVGNPILSYLIEFRRIYGSWNL